MDKVIEQLTAQGTSRERLLLNNTNGDRYLVADRVRFLVTSLDMLSWRCVGSTELCVQGSSRKIEK
jgi:hypothetical protein